MMKANKNLREGVCFKEHIDNFKDSPRKCGGLFYCHFNGLLKYFAFSKTFSNI